MARLKNKYMGAPVKLTATEEYEAKRRGDKPFDVSNMQKVSYEDALKVNPALADSSEYKDGEYYKDPKTGLIIQSQDYFGEQDLINITPVTREYSEQLNSMGMKSWSSKGTYGGPNSGNSKEKLKDKNVSLEYNRYAKSTSGKSDPQNKYYKVGSKMYTQKEYKQGKESGLFKTGSKMINSLGKPMQFRKHK